MKARRAGGAVLVLLLVVVVGAWWLVRDEKARDVSRGPVLEVAAPGPDDTKLPDLVAGAHRTTAEHTGGSASGDRAAGGGLAEVAASRTTGATDTSHLDPPIIEVSGWLVSTSGVPLADHVVRILRGSDVTYHRVIEAETRSTSGGRFTLAGLAAGASTIEVVGPGEGDVWIGEDRFRPHGPASDAPGIRPTSDEGIRPMDIGRDGLKDITLVSNGHPAFWVQGRIEGIADGAPDDAGAWSYGMQRPDDPADSRLGVISAGPPATLPLGSGRVLSTNFPQQAVVSGSCFMVPAWTRSATRLVVRIRWHREIVVDVQAPADLGIVDIGAVRTEPAGRIRAHVIERGTPQDVVNPIVRCLAHGGDHPDVELQPSRESEPGNFIYETDRSAGTWELIATAPGYKEAHLTGDMKPFLDIEVDVPMNRDGP